MPCISIDDDVHLENIIESPVDNEIVLDTDSHIFATITINAATLPMDTILPNEPFEPLPIESPIVDKQIPTTNVQPLPVSLRSSHSIRPRNQPSRLNDFVSSVTLPENQTKPNLMHNKGRSYDETESTFEATTSSLYTPLTYPFTKSSIFYDSYMSFLANLINIKEPTSNFHAKDDTNW